MILISVRDQVQRAIELSKGKVGTLRDGQGFTLLQAVIRLSPVPSWQDWKP
jgi:hypothetical protein